MPRDFDIPSFYRSTIISRIKQIRRQADARKKDLSPTTLKLNSVEFKIARHFGLCFGVENAIEIAYRALAENQEKRVFLLSEMIHNPHVNEDLRSRGVRFLLDTAGNELISFDELSPDDIVIVPAFGTTVELFDRLEKKGIDPKLYNTTCPFVEKVWKRAAQLGERGYTIVIHGKHSHEETRATFSHAQVHSPSLVIRDIDEANTLAEYLRGDKSWQDFSERFASRFSEGFEPERDLARIGVVNQTTMLATETQQISNILKEAMCSRFGEESLADHFADTRDTLCYATSENQSATYAVIESGADLALVVGGYNSSNTSHLVELCAEQMPAFFIKDADEILSQQTIRCLDLHRSEVIEVSSWLPAKRPLSIIVTAGASCPDAFVDKVIGKVASLFDEQDLIDPAIAEIERLYEAAEPSSPLRVLDAESS